MWLVRQRHAIFALGVFTLTLSIPAQAQTTAADRALLQQLQLLIQRQQEQLQLQAETIDSLKQRVDAMDEQSAVTLDRMAEVQESATKAVETAEKASKDFDSIGGASGDKIELAISGQINRAVNIIDDGNGTRSYFVDNDVSNSRLRFVGAGRVDENTSLGTLVEVAFSPNNSSVVSQDNQQATANVVDTRKVELFVRSTEYGQFLFGKGSAAADSTADATLALVGGAIMYSGVEDIAGGMQFTRDGNLTGVTVRDAFSSFDGGRQNRVGYDSPMFGDIVQFSLSAGDDERYDAALSWGGNYGQWTGVDIGSLTTLGAISIRDPGNTAPGVDYRIAGSFTALHNPSGLNAAISSGGEKRKNGDDPYNIYGQIGWNASFFELGETGFGIDATYSKNVRAQGDKAQSYGIAVIQLIENFGTEFYGQLRTYKLEVQNGNDPNDITVGTIGTRVKF